jgi:hypothetical protein
MGWTDIIVTEGNAPWSSAFWSAIRDGKSINQAHIDGLYAAKDYPLCKQLDPPSIWQYCKLENLYSQGSGCIHPLPEGMSSLAVQQLSSVNSEDQINGIFVDTQIQKFQIQDSQAIREFAGKSGLNPEYKKSVRYSYGTLDIFSSDNATYKVNRDTGRVQSLYRTNADTKSGPDVINLDQGYPIAEAYAKKNNPEIWVGIQNTTQTIVRSIGQTKQGHDLAYSWRQYILLQNISLNQSTEIAGFNTVDVTLDAQNGEVIMYHEWYQPLDTSLSLKPDISEELAWEKARQFYKKAGLKSLEKTERENFGLNIAIDEKNIQHLTWQFQIQQKSENGFDTGGQIGIDAHNGQVVWHATIG